MRAAPSAITLLSALAALICGSAAAAAPPQVAVAPQYDSTHVYVAPEDFDRFTASVTATLGGTQSRRGEFQVTPTPSLTMSQVLFTPAGIISVFGFKTPVPYPFGIERTGYLVTDLDAAVTSARALGASVTVAPFIDPIGRDAIIEWPGGVHMQLYWHTTTPNYAPLEHVPENRVYVAPDAADAFSRAFVAFSHGMVVADDARAPAADIGRPGEPFRRIRIESAFGKLVVLVTDGHLPYPFGRELTGYEVADLNSTLASARAAGVQVLAGPYRVDSRAAAIVSFPGGYIAEIHAMDPAKPAGRNEGAAR